MTLADALDVLSDLQDATIRSRVSGAAVLDALAMFLDRLPQVIAAVDNARERTEAEGIAV